MSANRNRTHVIILPEDQANHDIALGFRGHEMNSGSQQRQIQVKKTCRGWSNALSEFRDRYAPKCLQTPTMHVVILIDFDRVDNRREKMEEEIAESLRSRVFVLGVWTNPEDLRKQTGLSLHDIGRRLREDCPTQGSRRTESLWDHKLLCHNARELDRMVGALGPILAEP